MEGGKPENPEKNPRSKDENQKQTQPTYDTMSRIRTKVNYISTFLITFTFTTTTNNNNDNNNCKKADSNIYLIFPLRYIACSKSRDDRNMCCCKVITQIASCSNTITVTFSMECKVFLNEFYFLFFTFQRDLSGNQIGSIKVGVFSGLQKLSTL